MTERFVVGCKAMSSKEKDKRRRLIRQRFFFRRDLANIQCPLRLAHIQSKDTLGEQKWATSKRRAQLVVLDVLFQLMKVAPDVPSLRHYLKLGKRAEQMTASELWEKARELKEVLNGQRK